MKFFFGLKFLEVVWFVFLLLEFKIMNVRKEKKNINKIGL